jgi:uncharacterized membrane protein
MSKLTFLGHPLHPQLVQFPMGLFPFSLAMDCSYYLTGNEAFARTAFHSMVGGWLGGLAAAASGAADYFTIPPRTRSKKAADLHALLNLGMMGLYGINLLLRKGRQRPTGPVPVLLSLLGTAGLVLSGWLGGELVYELGMRVRPAMEGDKSPEWKLPGDKKMAEGLRKLERRLAPASGNSH